MKRFVVCVCLGCGVLHVVVPFHLHGKNGVGIHRCSLCFEGVVLGVL